MTFGETIIGICVGITLVMSASCSPITPKRDAPRASRSLLLGSNLKWEPQPLPYPADTGPGSYGNSVAIDANTAIVGSPSADGNGRAYVWRMKSGDWTIEKALQSPDTSVEFGRAVALSGNIAAVSAAVGNVGVVHVFKRDAENQWAWQRTLEGEADEGYGSALALRGAQLLIGAPNHGSGSGAAYWVPLGGSGVSTLPFETEAGGNLGAAVALADGYALVGSPNAKNYFGTAQIVKLTAGATPSYVETSADHPHEYGSFGSAVAIDVGSSTQKTLAVGAYSDGGSGAVFVFEEVDGTWKLRQKLVPDDIGSGDSFGLNIGLSGDLLLASSPNANFYDGRAYLYSRDGSSWTQIKSLEGASGHAFAYSLALFGRAVIVGAPGVDELGQATIYTQPDGQECAIDGECSHGHCVEKVCCDLPCAGECHSCLKKYNGAADGTCGLVPVNTDERGDCPDTQVETCGTTGVCSALGACVLYAKGITCKPATCVGDDSGSATTAACDGNGACVDAVEDCGGLLCADGACKAACRSDAECVASAYCSNAHCVPRHATECLADGSAVVLFDGTTKPCAPYRCEGAKCRTDCKANGDCADGQFCSEGVCCNEPCDEPCHSCLKAKNASGRNGVCEPVKPSMDPDPLCPSEDVSTCGTTGLCDASGHCARFAEGTQCRPDRCETSEALSVYACDDAHACKSSKRSCGSFACNSDRCEDTCTSDAQCDSGGYCADGICKARQPLTCVEGDSFSVSYDGTTTPCEAYRCEKGACRTDCDSSENCASGALCEADRTCKFVTALTSPTSSCTIGAARDGSSSLSHLAILFCSVMIRRRFVRRSSRRLFPYN